MSDSVYTKAWNIIRSFGAERPTTAETAATIKVLDRMGAFGSSERATLREAGWFD